METQDALMIVKELLEKISQLIETVMGALADDGKISWGEGIALGIQVAQLGPAIYAILKDQPESVHEDVLHILQSGKLLE